MTWRGLAMLGMVLLHTQAAVAQPPQTPANSMPFALWLDQFKREAIDRGLPEALVHSVFIGTAPDETIIKLDRKQPEGKISFTQYRTNALNARRIETGQRMMRQYRTVLQKISAKYHVPPQIIVALWGVETEYGANKGNFLLTDALATLAYEGRRADFFRNELFNALVIQRDEKVMPGTLTGSWAGAMGHCQFMPSTYLKYAVDWDGDGHRDIWNSVPDALASIANYLHGLGWESKQPWGLAVALPKDFPAQEADLYAAKPASHWKNKGVTLANGTALPMGSAQQTYVMFPGTPNEGAWLVFENYHRLLEWNKSRYFAHSVGLLADAIAQ